MKLNCIEIKNYRNITNEIIKPSEEINVLFGDNAQGKTNIIEAIWLFTGNQSFRGAKNSELIKFEKEQAKLSIVFEDEKREQKASLSLGTKKNIKLNNVELKSLNELNGNFYCVVFSPSDLYLIKDGPNKRRRFMDIAISQIKPQYKNYLQKYNKLLEQRNALLKSRETYKNLKEDIDVWDIQIARVGTIIAIYRNDYTKKLYKIAEKVYDGISGKKEKLSLKYNSTIFEDMSIVSVYDENLVEIYYKKLKDSYLSDIRVGSTNLGVHRDDLDIFIDEYSVKSYGSQGQQRSSVISLKLSEAELIRKITGEKAIMLLDDVMSELDEGRQDYILNNLKGMQVFITCCDYANTIKLNKGKVFNIKNGYVVKSSEIIL